MKYNGIELVPITEPQIFDPPKEMLVWDAEYIEPEIKPVCAITGSHYFQVITCRSCYGFCAEIPKQGSDTDYPVGGSYYDADNADLVIDELKADYKEALGRLQTANLIAKEQKEKANKLLSCLRCLVLRGLIKDCPEKEVATEIIKEFKYESV